MFLNFAMLSNQLLADLPPITFDSAEWVPYQTVGNNPASGWSLSQGDASVSPTGAGFNGGKALRLPVNPQQETKITRTIPWNAADTTAFIDVKIKPAADPSGSLSSFFVNGTQLAFQVPPGSNVGEVWVYHGNDPLAVPSINPQQWVRTVGTFNVSGTTATSYQRVTLRHDYQRNVWDLFIEGKLAAVNLAFEGRAANLTTLDFYGSRVGDTLIDDLSALTTNMLFPDADKDGLPDAWETVNGSNPNLYDRDQLRPGTITPFINLYMDSLWTTGGTNASQSVPASGGIPPLTIGTEAPHQAVGALKGALSVGADGSASYSLPIDIPKGTGGMEPKISLDYSSAGGNGIAGIGWSIGGLQSITRGPASHAKDGFAGAIRFDQNDRFFFNGERLICVAGIYGSINSEYRTEVDSYARITLLGGNQDSPSSWWRVETKAGLNIELGATGDSKTIPLGPNAPISWDVSKVSDTLGNYYSINWDGLNTPLNWIWNRRVKSIAYTGNSSLAPYCFIDFNYENRPDSSFAYHSTALRFESTVRLASIAVRTGSFVNHTYKLTYQTSAQSARSILSSVTKEISGGHKTSPTIFNWQGLPIGAPKWAKVTSSGFATYNGTYDQGNTGNYSFVSAANGTIKLCGDSFRYAPVPAGILMPLNSFIEFDFRAENPDNGAYIFLEKDGTWDNTLGMGLKNFSIRVKPVGATDLPSNSSNIVIHRTIAYTAAPGTWQTLRVPLLGSSTNPMFPANNIYTHIALANNNDSLAIQGSWSEFKNIRVGTAAQLDGNLVAPVVIPEVQEIPTFTKGDSSPSGARMVDVDSDGLIDVTDHRVVNWGSSSAINSAAARGQRGTVYKNLGNGKFEMAPGLVPGQDAILSDENDKWAYRHDLVATPCDVDGDGVMDLLVTDLRAGTNSATTSIQTYKFKRFLNGSWVDYPAYQLPFESRNNPSSDSHGGQRHLAGKSFMDLDRDGYADLLITTSSVGWLAAPNPLLSVPSNLKLVPESANAVYLNRVHLGLGWVKVDSLAPSQPLMNSDGDYPEGNGTTLADIDGDGFVEFVLSTASRPNKSAWFDTRLCHKLIPPSASGTLPFWDFNSSTNTRRDYGKFWLPTAAYPPTNSFQFSSLLLFGSAPAPTPVDGNAPLQGTDRIPTGTSLVDVNGDGLTDVVRAFQRKFSFEKNGTRIRNFERSHSTWFNQGSSSGSGSTIWSHDSSGYGYGYTLPVSLVGAGLDAQHSQNFSQFVDLNGDGLVDISYSREGNRYLGPLNSNLTTTEFGNMGDEGARKVRSSDPFGGANNGGFINNGRGWVQDPSWGLPESIRLGAGGYGGQAATFTDVNGDGFPDIIGKVLYGQRPEIWLNQCKPEVITSVTDGFGSELQVNYSRLNDPTPTAGFGSRVYEKGSASLPAGQAAVIDSRLVVSSYSESDGRGGRRVRAQRYGDLRYDRNNEASLGFGWVEAKDLLNGQLTRTDYRRDYPFAGSPERIRTWVDVKAADLVPTSVFAGVTPGLKCLSEETATYAEMPTHAGVGGTIRRPVQTASVKTLCDLKGVVVSQTTTTQELADFDEYGFVQKSTVTSLDGTTVVTTSDYNHDVTTTKWFLGRLATATVVKTGQNQTQTTKRSSFTYSSTTGLLKTETVEPGNSLSVTKSYNHDDFGNITSTTVTGSGGTRSSTSTYDPQGRFLLSESNALGHTVSYSYNSQSALLLSTTDIAGKTTSFGYDPYGTQTRTYHPDGTQTGESTAYSSNTALPASVSQYITNPIVFVRAKQTSGAPVAKVYFDRLGREVVAESTILRDANSNGASRYSKVYTLTQYDTLGRKTMFSQAFGAGDNPNFTRIYYDVLSRPLITEHPDGTSDQTVELKTVVLGTQPVTYTKGINAKTGIFEQWRDQHDRMIQSSDPSGQITVFEYDLENRLRTASVANVLLLTNTFDTFGNKTSVNEANSGTSSSVYNAFREVTSSTNAKGQTTTFTYDSLGRTLTVTKPEGAYTTEYLASGPAIGSPWRTTGPSGYQETISYDSLGRPLSTTKTQFSETFSSSTVYDALGRTVSTTDAGGLTTLTDYDPQYSIPIRTRIGLGTPGAGTVLWQAGTFDSRGRALTQTLAQGVTASAAYNPTTGFVTSTAAAAGATSLQNKSYAWDAVGNLSSRTDSITGRIENFTYDASNRVTQAAVSGSGSLPASNFTYAANGNLLTKGTATLNYAGTRPHAVSTATIKGVTRTYAYDAAGYVTSDSKRTYGWTSFGQLSALDYLSAPALQTFGGLQIYTPARVQTNFQFDAGGNRAQQIKERIAANDSRIREETLYLGSYERETHSTRTSGSSPPITTRTVHRHSIGGLAVYTRTVLPGVAGQQVKLTTILKDHLGSTDVLYTSTWNGSAWVTPTTERQSFDAWGERRDPTTLAAYRTTDSDAFHTSGNDYDRGYTSHEQLDDSGLIHMNGRIYDPELGRMLSPDPFVQVPEFSQNFNRYSYVMNNPLNLTDPTGFSWLSKVIKKIGNWIKENWRTIVVIVVAVVLYATGIGSGIATALLGTTLAGSTAFTIAGVAVTYGQIAIGAVIGSITGGLGSALNGGNLGDVLRGALIGGAQGAISSGYLHGLGEAASAAGTFSIEMAQHIVGHGILGGAVNLAMGQKFQDGFISAAVSVSAAHAGLLGKSGGGNLGAVKRTIAAGIVGGTASALGGGKFANGAYTAAFQHLLNNEGFYDRISNGGEVDENAPIGLQMRSDLDASAPEMRAAGAETGMVMVSIIPVGRALSAVSKFIGGIGSRIARFAGFGGGKVAPAAHLAAKTTAPVIQFGKVENQVSHAFRHIEAAGLERSAVQSAVQTHLQGAASQVVAGKPFNAIVEVGGQRLQYTAFKLPDGTLNVGRIHPVK